MNEVVLEVATPEERQSDEYREIKIEALKDANIKEHDRKILKSFVGPFDNVVTRLVI